MKDSRVVCVLGMHRSGTSVASRLCALLGAQLGPAEHLMKPGPPNPRGYWEHALLSDLNERILAALGGSWHAPPPLDPGWERSAALAELRREARHLLAQDFGGAPFWAWKDPRTSLTLPFWRPMLGPDARFVVCIRSPLAVAHSQADRDGRTPDAAGAVWQHYTRRALEHTSGEKRMLLFYDDLMEAPQREFERLARFVGALPRARQVETKRAFTRFLTQELRHHTISDLETLDEGSVPFPTRALYAALRLAARIPSRGTRAGELDALVETLARGGWEDMVEQWDARQAGEKRVEELSAAKEAIEQARIVGKNHERAISARDEALGELRDAARQREERVARLRTACERAESKLAAEREVHERARRNAREALARADEDHRSAVKELREQLDRERQRSDQSAAALERQFAQERALLRAAAERGERQAAEAKRLLAARDEAIGALQAQQDRNRSRLERENAVVAARHAAELESVRAQVESEVARLRDEAHAAREALESERSSLVARLEAETETLRQEFESERDELHKARRDAVAEARESARVGLAHETMRNDLLEQEKDRVVGLLDETKREHAVSKQELERLHGELAKVHEQLARVRGDADTMSAGIDELHRSTLFQVVRRYKAAEHAVLKPGSRRARAWRGAVGVVRRGLGGPRDAATPPLPPVARSTPEPQPPAKSPTPGRGASPPGPEAKAPAAAQPPTAGKKPALPPGVAKPVRIERARMLDQKLAPLEIAVDRSAPRRINCLVPTIEPGLLYGGYISYLNFIRRLCARGHRVRFVVTEICRFDQAELVRAARRFPGLAEALERVEFVAMPDREHPLDVNPRDTFIAYCTWDALRAHATLAHMGRQRFFFYIQEFEPIFHGHDAIHAITRSAYDLPHYALINSDLLRDYFEERRIGVFAEPGGADRVLCYRHALTPVRPPDVVELASRRQRRLVFYARPEEHAGRNLFEIGFLGLRKAVAQGVFDASWSLEGIGSLAHEGGLDLGGGRELAMQPRTDQEGYARLLSSYDLGVCLQYAPHPSVPNLEMAAAGQIVVTSTFENRPRQAMEALSPNIVATEPTVDGVVAALRRAVERTGDFHARVRGAAFDWPRKWEESFDEAFLARFESMMEADAGGSVRPQRLASGWQGLSAPPSGGAGSAA